MSKYLDSCKDEFWQKVFEKEAEYLLRELKGCKDILSVGCGPAIIEAVLQEKGFNVTGLDVSQEALEGVPDMVRTEVGSAESMEFSDESFDAVIYVASLQFIENYEKAIYESARVLREGGRFIAMLLNPESEFFKGRVERTDSYVAKIKHRDVAAIEKTIAGYFTVQTEYLLGIKGKEIFDSQEPSSALYIVKGIKK